MAYWVLPSLAEFVAHGALRLDPASALGSAVGFFLYDVPKILLLLALVVFLIGIVRSFFSPERTRKMLGGKREGVGNVLAVGAPLENAHMVISRSAPTLAITDGGHVALTSESCLPQLEGIDGASLIGLSEGHGKVWIESPNHSTSAPQPCGRRRRCSR